MNEIILSCMMALFFVVGYYIMKKVDFFLYKIEKKIPENSYAQKLKIAFEYSEDVVLLEDAIEKTLKNNQISKFEFFFGTYEEIKYSIKKGKIDVGFLDFKKPGQQSQGSCSVKMRFIRKSIPYKGTEIQFDPFESNFVEKIVVWRKNNMNNILPIFIECLTINNCQI